MHHATQKRNDVCLQACITFKHTLHLRYLSIARCKFGHWLGLHRIRLKRRTTVQFTHLHLLLLNYAATSHHAVSGSPRHVSALKACRCLLRPCYCSAFEALLKHSEGPFNPFQSLLRSFQALLRLFEGSLRPI